MLCAGAIWTMRIMYVSWITKKGMSYISQTRERRCLFVATKRPGIERTSISSSSIAREN